MAVLAHVAGDIHGAVYDKYERLKEKRAALVAWERHLARSLAGGGHECRRRETQPAAALAEGAAASPKGRPWSRDAPNGVRRWR